MKAYAITSIHTQLIYVALLTFKYLSIMFTAKITSVVLGVITENVYDKNGIETGQHIELIHANVSVAYTDVDATQRVHIIRRVVSRNQAMELTRLLITGEDILLYNVKGEECAIISDGDEV